MNFLRGSHLNFLEKRTYKSLKSDKNSYKLRIYTSVFIKIISLHNKELQM